LERDFELVLSVYPVLFQLSDYPFVGVHETIAAFADEEHLAFVDLLPAFQGQAHSTMWVHRTDQHPNEVAQGLAAAELASRLRDMGII
jgi:hypothetical protein